MEDTKIVQLYWDRDQSAITHTAEKYGKYCTTIAKNILDSLEDAEECVNDTYLTAWNTMPPQMPKLLAAFLGKITRNLSFNRFKHNRAEKRGGGEVAAVLDELSECVSGTEDVEQEIFYRELLEAVNSFLADLPATKRGIFVSRYWYTAPISDIALHYNMKENAVSMTLIRLRKNLRSYLLKRGFQL